MLSMFWKAFLGREAAGLRQTVEVFRENAEKAAGRDHALQQAALAQLAAEYARPHRGLFDCIIDGVNRLPRPMMALGTLGLMVAAMADPYWFAARMQGLALVPEPLWWLLGIVVSFYFGARVQVKSQEFHRSMAAGIARAPEVLANISASQPDTASVRKTDENPALTAWKSTRDTAPRRP